MTLRTITSCTAAGLALTLGAIAGITEIHAAIPAKVTGKITKVDIQARTLTVDDAAAGPLSFLVDEKTVIVLDGDEQATLDDLFEGDEVLSATARELSSGKLLLLKATVTSQPPAGGDEPGEGPQDESPKN